MEALNSRALPVPCKMVQPLCNTTWQLPPRTKNAIQPPHTCEYVPQSSKSRGLHRYSYTPFIAALFTIAEGVEGTLSCPLTDECLSTMSLSHTRVWMMTQPSKGRRFWHLLPQGWKQASHTRTSTAFVHFREVPISGGPVPGDKRWEGGCRDKWKFRCHEMSEFWGWIVMVAIQQGESTHATEL